MKQLKRVTALALSVFLLLALIPPTAFAWTGPDVSVPDGHELVYFVDCGASSFPSGIQSLLQAHSDTLQNPNTPDQAYNGTWGYTNATEDVGVNSPDSGDIYTSIRHFQSGKNGLTLQYQFDAPAGDYQVVVGLYDPWSIYAPSRSASVSVNGGAAQTFSYNSGASALTFDVAVTGDEDLTVNVAPTATGDDDDDVMASFIMVTRKVEQPAPTQPDAPTASTSIWGKDGQQWMLDVTYRCTNDSAVHQGGNEVTEPKNFISGKFFTFGEMTLNGDTWEVPATVQAAAMLEDQFGQAHTVTENPQVTLEYVNNKWCIQTDAEKALLTVEGTCSAAGPAIPELGTNLDVWFQLYAGEYDPVAGRQLSIDPTQYSPCLSFGQPYNDNGTWKCEMTITAYSQDQEQAASCPANLMMPQGYEIDPALVVNGTVQQTVTLTYDQDHATWECPLLPRTQTTHGPGDTTSPDHSGVAFLVVEEGSEPAPALPVPGETVVYTQDNVWLTFTYICTNENSVHSSNPATNKRDALAKQYLKAVSSATQNDEGVWTCTATVDTAAILEDTFKAPHTAQDTTITLVYNQSKTRWEIPADATVSFSGSCDAQGPEAPSSDNCTDFSITVYGAEPKTDDSVVNQVLSGLRWDLVGDKATVTFGTPTKGEDGVWTCTATVDAAKFVEEVAQEKASSHYRVDETDPTTKTVTLTYKPSTAKWVAASDGVTYGYPSNPSTRNGVAFRLIKQYEVTFTPGRDLTGAIPSGEETSGGFFDKGATVELPETTTFTTENGIFAGWRASIKNGTQTTIHFFPIGTDMTMFGQDVELEAYWMDVDLDVASVAYDPDLAVGDYTFGDPATVNVSDDSVTLLFRATVKGNSQYPYALTCEDATVVYDSALSGTIQKYHTTQYVYFTKTYPVQQSADLTETVTMGNAQDTATVHIAVPPALPVPGETVLETEGDYWMPITYTCTNENSVHQSGNPTTTKIKMLSKAYLKAVAPAVQDQEGRWTTQVTVDAAAMITNAFKMEHTADDVTLTVVYDEASGEWLIPTDSTLSITGVCTPQGPEAPSKSNCTDFYVTIYGAQPKNDDTVTNSSLRSTRWDILGDQINVTFGTPTKGEDGVWTCTATVEADDYVRTVAESQASSHYRLDETDPTTKTVTLTYNQTKAKWVAASDGISYGSASNPTTKNGVAFRLIKQYEVTFAPGRDLDYHIPAGDEFSGGCFDKGTSVELPETTTFVAENGIFAGWRASIKNGTQTTTYYFPIGTDMTMFGQDVTLEAYWMDVDLDVASVAYDPDLAVGDYTFGATADFSVENGPITLLYRATVKGNSQYPYTLTCDGATAVYDSVLSGTIQKYQATQYVYFTKTYNPQETTALTETVDMGNAQGTAQVNIEVTGHIYGDPVFQWSEDGQSASAQFTCTLCGEEHTENATITSAVKDPATCTQMGTTTYTATVVFQDETYTSTQDVTDIPATGHTTQLVGQKDATCTEDGYTGDLICTVCNETVTKGEVIPATGHTTQLVGQKDATCTQDGYTGDLVCSVCNETVTKGEVIPATGHTTQLVGQKDATCTEDGYTGDLVCSVCNETITKGEVIPATGHTTQLVGQKDATCTQDGYTGDLVCSVCEEIVTKGEVIPATGHTYQNGVCTKCGEKDPQATDQPDATQNPGEGNVPPTGDTAQVTLWLSVCTVCMGMLAVMLVSKKRIRR